MTKRTQTLGWLLHALCLLLLGAFFVYVARQALTEPSFGIDTGATNVREGRSDIVDFPSHHNFVRHVWSRNTTVGEHSVYSVENHLWVTSDWAGRELDHALPFGYSPTMVWLLLPLSALPTGWAHLAFGVISLLAIGWLTRPGASPHGLGMLAFLNPLAAGLLWLGQTAAVTLAGIVALVRQGAESTLRDDLIAGAIVWALTAKPPVAMVAIVGLLAARRWKPVVAGVAASLVTAAVVTPWLGIDWIPDYPRCCKATITCTHRRRFVGVWFPSTCPTSALCSAWTWACPMPSPCARRRACGWPP